MTEKQVKTRNIHKCDICGLDIEPGSAARFGEGKYGPFDKNDTQVGIKYYKYWIHEKCAVESYMEAQYDECTNTNGSQGQEYQVGCKQDCGICDFYKPTE